ncbi:C-GCAxxG-C-C family protein [Halanaerobium praevalens]|uniref:C_GCAxxG_C_C family protein n=1 Tax=Halanaerobium praevalens (strain ATCC 33744 / DSM 2228 / GSL) TaxID=572479 RepID=E3DNX7_HALPG|nr:C-GCAxxG-C-C family protein [Halanaerobium praevalens]ADO76601.1 C_GCAxxG_C_C family protein [Halanaerobium praevalens DSM 2228]
MLKKSEKIAETRKTAEDYFRRGDYFCSEAVITTINNALGQPFDPAIVKMASGFPIGIGKSKCLCGAVSGGVMALGLAYGREKPGAEMPDSFPNNAALHNYIINTYGSTCCRVLTKDFPDFKSEARAKHCIQITGEVAAWVMENFIENGVVEVENE